ncbi:MAG: response regulator [Holophaga sp.]|nr:response regulator [Holophaga sp.]
MLGTQAPSFTILIAEDDDGHADLVVEQLQDAGLRCPIRRFRDGQEVVDFLHPAGGGSWDQPCVLLLDINMPRLDGIAVLKRLKGDPGTRSIPVIMLTTTDDPVEVAACYKLGCNLYITKPVEFEAFAETLERLGRFLQVLQVVRP